MEISSKRTSGEIEVTMAIDRPVTSLEKRSDEISCRLLFGGPSSASLDHHSAAVARDLWFFLGGDNLDLVCEEAKKLETVGR